MLLFLWACAAARVVAVVSCHLFSGQNESASLFSFFLLILTPDKAHCLWGNWRRGSCFVLAVLSGVTINQVIYCVRGRPFSIEFMTCCKKQMLQRYWKFARYIIIWRERATMKDEGWCFITISLQVYTSRWGGPFARSLSLTDYTLQWYSRSWLFSMDHVLVQWFSTKQKSHSNYLGLTFNWKAETVMEHGNSFIIVFLFLWLK